MTNEIIEVFYAYLGVKKTFKNTDPNISPFSITDLINRLSDIEKTNLSLLEPTI